MSAGYSDQMRDLLDAYHILIRMLIAQDGINAFDEQRAHELQSRYNRLVGS